MQQRIFVASRFEPKFGSGEPINFYLPLLHDLLLAEKPRLVVILGLGDAQVHLALCQAAREQGLETRCVAFRRPSLEELAEDDPAWNRASKISATHFATTSELRWGDTVAGAASFPDASVDLLLIDDVDSGTQVSRELDAWQPKLSSHAIILLHGVNLERADPPRSGWSPKYHRRVCLPYGIGLEISAVNSDIASSPARQFLFTATEAAGENCRLGAELMSARARARRAQEQADAIGVRQFWFDAIIDDRRKAQQIMDEQKAMIGSLTERLSELDRLKNLVSAAKAACRNKGRCFHLHKAPKPKLSVPQKLVRELKRIPRNVGGLFSRRPNGEVTKVGPATAENRYTRWIKEHEPPASGLTAQEAEARQWLNPPRISLLIPVLDPPPKFLEALLASIAAQSYQAWEACIVDAGSRSRAVVETLHRWQKIDPRFQIQRLERNLGIAENTNRALEMAGGEFVAPVDHDDTLAPFALYELARAIRAQPEADIFYSDEDRLSRTGQRVKPFFKPEWSPELLFSFMYLGHLTAYRRDFVTEVGRFRREFELSQDYDFALRATERARGIVHIPRVLYHWREHAASGAGGGKPHARQSNLAALADAARRRGLSADILEYPTANRLRMQLPQPLKVSVIIPTDSATHARYCAIALPQATGYGDVEFVIVTKSSLIAKLHGASERVRFVAFDDAFNFSAKCNAGARAAAGERLVFVNDDVEATQQDWIENVIEPLQRPEVGAVAPKLLYADGRIQHAGLVTGVRGLVGTAMHQWSGDSTDYANFAQSMRPVSALSAACLAMRRDDFFRVGGFDEINTPIAHSDFDLCFKVRAAGMRCVYTPFASLVHRGHASIGATDSGFSGADKSDIFLLRRWGQYTGRDPYFTDNMRDWLYADSPETIQMSGGANSERSDLTRDLLIVSHELSLTGAPIIIAHLAAWCREHGVFPVVLSPSDGPARRLLEEAGIFTIADPLLRSGFEAFTKFGGDREGRSHKSFLQLARNFDCVLASTILAAPLVRDLAEQDVPTIWWIHEGIVGEQFLKKHPLVGSVLAQAKLVLTPDKHSGSVYQPFVGDALRVLPHGIPDLRTRFDQPERQESRVRFLLLGSVESRKGQGTFLEALSKIPSNVLPKCEFLVVGRPHDPRLAAKVRGAVNAFPQLRYEESVPHVDALRLINRCDVMICTSTDETGPLTLIEALALEKTILTTPVGCVGERLIDKEEALFVPIGDAAGLAAAIERLVAEPALRQKLAKNGRTAYERHFRLEQFGADFVHLLEEAITAQEKSFAPKRVAAMR